MEFNAIIDLSHTIESDMITFGAPWHTNVMIEQMGKIKEVGRETRKITIGTHSGTHIDAPAHFIAGGDTIDKLPLNKLCGSVKIVDFTHLSPETAVSVNLLSGIVLTQRMIFKFGWGKYWNTPKFYIGYPYFTTEAAEYLVSNGAELIGMDTPSPDDSKTKLLSDKNSQIHKIFLQDDVILIEYLNLENVIEYNDWTLLAMPLKIKSGDGSPARICIAK